FEDALRVLQDLGAKVVEVDAAPFRDARAPNTTILLAEAYAYHEHTLKAQPDKYGTGVRNRLREGAFISAADYIQALRARTAISASGLPVGLEIAGRAFEETTVFRLAHAFEQATDWHKRVPQL